MKKLIKWLYFRAVEKPIMFGLHYDEFNFEYLKHEGYWYRITRYKYTPQDAGTVYGERLMEVNLK